MKGGSATITGNTINGSIKFEELTEVVVANGNSSTGNMQCKENLPPPTGVGNSATSMEDECALL